jgi:tetratricopeptide (TPR) repeat protein
MSAARVINGEFSFFHQLDDVPVSKREGINISIVDLKLLISRARHEGDSLTMGYLLQALGDLEAQEGNMQAAHSLHREAIELDSHTPLPYLLYATGLFRAFNRSDLAVNQIRELRVLLRSGEWKPTVNDPSRNWYMNELNALSEEIKMWHI